MSLKLYAAPFDVHSHWVRLVLQEKELEYQINWVQDTEPEKLNELNPYGMVPTLVEREALVYPAHLIAEYLDERFPHPPLLPPSPSERAKARLLIYRIERDWYSQLKIVKQNDKTTALRASKSLSQTLTAIAPLFKEERFFLGTEFSLVDCAFAPLLYQVIAAKIALPQQAKPLLDYADTLFQRPSFKRTLLELEGL